MHLIDRNGTHGNVDNVTRDRVRLAARPHAAQRCKVDVVRPHVVPIAAC